MATSATTLNTSPTNHNSDNYLFPLCALTVLFFMWGFITCLNDILIPHLKNVFSLSYTQASLIQFCFFGAYFVVSVPAGKIVKRIGYKSGIVLGLVIASIGCLLFFPAASIKVYELFLGALFVLASGITILQVAANPYVTVLGKPERAPGRLTLTQAFNSAGTTIAPVFGSVLILSAAAAGSVEIANITSAELTEFKNAEASAVKIPYLMLAAALLIIAAIFALLKLPKIEIDEEKDVDQSTSIFSFSHLTLGAVGIFVYVGAEVAIGSYLVNLLGEKNIAGLEEAEAAKLLTYYWGGAMVGRFIGAALMTKIKGGVLLAFNAVIACILLLVTILGSGQLAMYSVLLVGLFNSIMFPVIFSLGVNSLGSRTSEGSGILCLAIVGGAIVPLLMGILADNIGLQLSFWLPLVCYIYIAYYGLIGSKPKQQLS